MRKLPFDRSVDKAENAVYKARGERGTVGLDIYNQAIKKNLI